MGTPKSEGLSRILELASELGDEIKAASQDELEEITDILIDDLLERIPLPRFLPFVRGWLRKKLDALFPDVIFAALAAAAHKVRVRRAGTGAPLP